MIKHKFYTRNGSVNKENGFVAMLNQVHGSECIVVDGAYEGLPDADAMVTRESNITLGIITADCAPVLFEGKTADGKDVIGAAHAGWRSAVSGVCQNTIDKMVVLGCEKNTVKAMIGPCIGRLSYEVDSGFYEKFQGSEHCFTSLDNDGHYMFDLAGYIKGELLNYGVGSVHIDGRDTYLLEDEFFSYRRSTHRREIECGRQVSTIMIC